MVKHVILWNLKDELGATEKASRRELKRDLRALKERSPDFLKLR